MGSVHHLPTAGRPPVQQTADETVLAIMSGGDIVQSVPVKVERPGVVAVATEDDNFLFFADTPFVEPEKRAPAPAEVLEQMKFPPLADVVKRVLDQLRFDADQIRQAKERLEAETMGNSDIIPILRARYDSLMTIIAGLAAAR